MALNLHQRLNLLNNIVNLGDFFNKLLKEARDENMVKQANNLNDWGVKKVTGDHYKRRKAGSQWFRIFIIIDFQKREITKLKR